MKRNLLLLAVMVLATLLFSSQSWAQTLCDPEELVGTKCCDAGKIPSEAYSRDLGICDSLYVETIPCDHTYEATAGYDSVRVGIFVTHDSNTFLRYPGLPQEGWCQDSIKAFTIPLKFWHQPAGQADSVILPDLDNGFWNNVDFYENLSRSIFRDIVCPAGTITNQMKTLKWNYPVLTIYDGHSCDGDTGLLLLTILNLNKKNWYQGSKQLLATLTFLVYMNPCPTCDTTEIGFDSTYVEAATANLQFIRIDAKAYVPQFLPHKDTIYIVPCLPPDITCPGNEQRDCSGTYLSKTAFTATDPNADLLIEVQTVNWTGTLPPGITGVTMDYTTPGDVPPPAKTVIGHVQYTANHCSTGGAITLIATNNCEPPQSKTCQFNVTFSTNVPPTVDCPDDVSGPYDETLVSEDYDADDECAPPTVTWRFEGDPTNDPEKVDQHFTWDAFCTETITIWVIVTDDCGAKDSCSFTMTGENTAPEVTEFALPTSIGSGNAVTAGFNYTDDENGVVAAGGYADCGDISVDLGDKEFTYTAPTVTVPTTCNVCIVVEDECGLTDTLCKDIEISVKPVGCEITVEIPNKVYERFGFGHWDYFPWDKPQNDNSIECDDACPPYNGINPGDFFEIPIILSEDVSYPIGGFELQVEFDYIDLTFYGAERGGLLSERYYTHPPYPPYTDSVLWSWEYFTYRLCPCTVTGCQKYKILLYGQAEMPDGIYRSGYSIDPRYVSPEATPGLWWYDDVTECEDSFASLVWLKFQVANNELLRDLKLPIVFEWEHKLGNIWPYQVIQDWDCTENTMSNATGGVFYVSCNTIQYSDLCPDADSTFHILYFVDGGPHICSPCTAFTCVRGDINMDKVPNTVADAVMLARYFVYGINVFQLDRDEQVCATDVNADGRTLMLSDLIYLIRVAQNDAMPYPKLGPSSDVVNVIVSDGKITVECASAIGGLLFKFDGNVTPTLLNTNMDILSNESNVLVWSSAGNSIAGASQLLTASGANLVSVIAVDREGRDLATTITTKLTPTAFALHPAYPNPFNPNTNLSFTLPNATAYSMNIYNVAGQLVRSYEGMGNVGLNVITWDGKDNAGNAVSSGVYFYKLSAGNFTATNKMVMMK